MTPELMANQGFHFSANLQPCAYDDSNLNTIFQPPAEHVPFQSNLSPNAFGTSSNENFTHPTAGRYSTFVEATTHESYSLEERHLGTIISVNTTPPSLVIKSEISEETITAFGFSNAQLRYILKRLGKGAAQVSYTKRRGQHSFYAAEVQVTGFVDHESWKTFEKNSAGQRGLNNKPGGVKR